MLRFRSCSDTGHIIPFPLLYFPKIQSFFSPPWVGVEMGGFFPAPKGRRIHYPVRDVTAR